MKLILILSFVIDTALAQGAAYSQCGGNGWTGATSCVSGYSCVSSNPYYSQCIPGSGGGGGGGGGSNTPTQVSGAAPAAQTTFCEQYGLVMAGNYMIINNLWGMGDATSGSECTFYNGLVGSGVSWGTTWTWQGGQYKVKSYPDARLTFTPKIISQISSLPSTFTWSYSGDPGVSDVAYDLFTSSQAVKDASSGEYELMIWLAYYGGAFPISSSGQPIATVNIAGFSWKLYYGFNGSMKVYSFLSTQNPLNNFSGDVKLFFTYLASTQGYPISSQYLNTFQGGIEPFTGGPATFTASLFSAAVN